MCKVKSTFVLSWFLDSGLEGDRKRDKKVQVVEA